MALIDRANVVEFIFEEKVIESHPYYSNNGRSIRASNTIQITKILKGNLECGTVEIITNGGEINRESLEISHSLNLDAGSVGLFLCDLTDRPVSVLDFYPETNLMKLEGTFERQSFIRYWWDGEGINAADIWSNFDQLVNFYNLAELVTGLTFIDCVENSLLPENNTIDMRMQIVSLNPQIASFHPSSITGGVG